jgi:hypothetical protein
VATINAPEPRVLIVPPFDRGQTKIGDEWHTAKQVADRFNVSARWAYGSNDTACRLRLPGAVT